MQFWHDLDLLPGELSSLLMDCVFFRCMLCMRGASARSLHTCPSAYDCLLPASAPAHTSPTNNQPDTIPPDLLSAQGNYNAASARTRRHYARLTPTTPPQPECSVWLARPLLELACQLICSLASSLPSSTISTTPTSSLRILTTALRKTLRASCARSWRATVYKQSWPKLLSNAALLGVAGPSCAGDRQDTTVIVTPALKTRDQLRTEVNRARSAYRWTCRCLLSCGDSV
jgi:hypothetical protein